MGRKIAVWEGEPIETLSREKLIEALQWCASEMETMRDDSRRNLEMLKIFSKSK